MFPNDVSSHQVALKRIHLLCTPHQAKPKKMMQQVHGMFLPFCGLSQQADPTLTRPTQHVEVQ